MQAIILSLLDTGLYKFTMWQAMLHSHQPVAKLSDSPGKTLCADQTFLAYLRQVLRITEQAPC